MKTFQYRLQLSSQATITTLRQAGESAVCKPALLCIVLDSCQWDESFFIPFRCVRPATLDIKFLLPVLCPHPAFPPTASSAFCSSPSACLSLPTIMMSEPEAFMSPMRVPPHCRCFVCGKSASEGHPLRRCSGCRMETIVYCGRQCQEAHWPVHKCVPTDRVFTCYTS